MKALVRIPGFWICTLLLAFALTGCAAKTVQTKAPPPRPKTAPSSQNLKSTAPAPVRPAAQDQSIAGVWRIVDSSAKFKISFAGTAIHIEGWDSADGEKFIITGVQWNGKKLTGAFKMPSTGYTTYSDLELTDKDTLTGVYKSADGSGAEVWKRE